MSGRGCIGSITGLFKVNILMLVRSTRLVCGIQTITIGTPIALNTQQGLLLTAQGIYGYSDWQQRLAPQCQSGAYFVTNNMLNKSHQNSDH